MKCLTFISLAFCIDESEQNNTPLFVSSRALLMSFVEDSGWIILAIAPILLIAYISAMLSGVFGMQIVTHSFSTMLNWVRAAAMRSTLLRNPLYDTPNP